MISNKIGLEYAYDYCSKTFKIAFDFLHRDDLASLDEGWIDLEDGVRVSVQHYNTIDSSNGYFETHKKYFDIQYVVEGSEYCGVCNKENIGVVRTEYDEKNDIEFYEDPKNCSLVLLNAGDYIVLAPENAHKPRLKVGVSSPVKKIVIKVPVR